MVAVVRAEIRWTPSGVRLRRRVSRGGDLNWLFVPGGPGLGSESLHELVDTIEVPGDSWMVDLPGDGSNLDAPGAPADPCSLWPQVLLEAAHAIARPVFVGHSTGGHYLLSVPALEGCLEGLVLISTAPDASWLPAFEQMTRHNPLPGVKQASARYQSDPNNEHLRLLTIAAAPWNFTHRGLAQGTEMLARMPYNSHPVQWSEANFDHTYQLTWWPTQLPTLIVSGSADRIVTQTLWQNKRFHTPNTLWRVITDTGHFPWIEQPTAVHDAFAALTQRISIHPATP
jgi:pimeloyl-ACP methyl ester carboxylesterase